MKYTVYILHPEKDNKRYIGFTDNIESRFIEHNMGKVKSTKNRRPLKIMHTEEYENKTEAMQRESYFKTHAGRDYLKSIGK